MRKGLVFAVVLFLQISLTKSSILAQTPKSWTSADIYLGLKKLNVLGSVLYVAAHPDDENTRLITYFSKDKLYRTGYLSLTRGDGGQNLIGNEQGVELGLIRTQELLAARRIDGGEQFFTRAFDFGFSKNPGETFTKWDREKILSDVVWVIRKFQPEIIITRFPVTGEGGHGHHTASAILANEAFTAAADPNRFPEQLKQGVSVWQAKRILWNTFNFGATNTINDDQFKFDVGGYNPLLGKSYGEIAAESRSQHKSQGFGVPASRGLAMEYFKTTGGAAPLNDLMDGIDLTWKKVKGGEAISKMIDKVIAAFDLLRPENSVKDLVKLYTAIATLPDGYWKAQKLKETQQLIEQCSGLFLDITSATAFAVQTDSVRINFSLNNRLGADATIKDVAINDFDSAMNQVMDKNKNISFAKVFFIPKTKEITQPYWLANKMEQGYYNVTDQQKIGQPDIDPAYTATVTISIAGRDFKFSRPVRYKFTDPVRGEIYQPVPVIPAVTFGEISPFYLKNNQNGEIDASVIAHCDAATSSAKVPDAQTASNDTLSLPFTYQVKKDNVVHFPYQVSSLENKIYRLRPSDEAMTGKILKTIHYDHIPTVTYFKDAVTKIMNLDLKTYGKRIGYIVGAGDKIPEALEQMGYEVTILGDKELSKNNLQQFDAIIAGVRAYNTDEWLNNHYDALMKYVNDGGNLIAQYNTSTQIGPIRAKMGPYNFDITRTRVTDENAIVKFLNPEDSVLNFPNKITADDFKDWVQERSIYHAANWDKNFRTVFSMNDPGETADEGSLIIAKYGKGYFTYTGLVFYRELPAGIPGAYRLLANLIALNRKKAF
ncbi:MAG: PIG-L family deacetylase [Chitinophagaceae bacterium]